MSGLIFVLVAVVVVASGGLYAWQSGLLNFLTQQSPTVEVEIEQAPVQQETVIEDIVEEVQIEEAEEEQTAEERIAEYKAKPTLCESDSDCKIIPISCNKSDCGRAVNNYIEPYACSEADKANPVNVECPASKAVCDDGVCKKVNA